MKLINLTPHAINIVNSEGSVIKTIEPSGEVARCKTQRVKVDSLEIEDDNHPCRSCWRGCRLDITRCDYAVDIDDNGYGHCPYPEDMTLEIPINETRFGKVEGLPEPEEDTMYIVSALVAQACKDRNDLVIPDDTVRDDEGKIIGCKALARI